MFSSSNLMMALSAGRILVGAAAVVAPEAFGKQWFGRVARDPAAQVAIRAFGVRDLALGVATIGTLKATGTDGMGFKVLAGLGVLCDAVDAGATIGARAHLPAGGTPTVAVASAAAAVGMKALAQP